MPKLSFVYFDVGGVALKDLSDTPKWDQILAELGLNKFDPDQVESIYKSHDDSICTGKFDLDQLLPLYQQQFGIVVPQEYSLLTTTIDNFAPNNGIWPIIEHCQKKAKIGLLTDMWPRMFPELVKRQLLPPYTWDAIIDSSIEGVRKPMPEIYEIAQSRAGVPAAEILFIDNREKNLVIPRTMGWQTFLYDSSNYDQANQEFATFINTFAI